MALALMHTPHPATSPQVGLTNAPAEWWKEKKSVADRIGNALLISNTQLADARRVVGLFQQRATSGGAEHVQLKTAASKRDGAGIRQLKLEDALDSTKWRVIPHFYESTFDMHGDTARVIDTEESAGTIAGVRAVLTMKGQPPGPEAVYPLIAFLLAWVPELEAPADDADVANVRG